MPYSPTASNVTIVKPQCIASRVASIPLTTEAQPLMPQTHGTSSGVWAAIWPDPVGNGRPIQNARGARRASVSRILEGWGQHAPQAKRRWQPEREQRNCNASHRKHDETCGGESWKTLGKRCSTAAAEASKQQETTENHSHGIERMAKKEDEALHGGDLDKQKGHSPGPKNSHQPTIYTAALCCGVAMSAREENKQ